MADGLVVKACRRPECRSPSAETAGNRARRPSRSAGTSAEDSAVAAADAGREEAAGGTRVRNKVTVSFDWHDFWTITNSVFIASSAVN